MLLYQLKTVYQIYQYKINSLQIYDTAQMYKILHKVVQHLSQQNIKISNKLVGMSMTFQCTKLYISKWNSS
jgi:dihydroxyacetone kinase